MNVVYGQILTDRHGQEFEVVFASPGIVKLKAVGASYPFWKNLRPSELHKHFPGLAGGQQAVSAADFAEGCSGPEKPPASDH